jgi:multidrug efflux pump subunit AcrA (membrane-fusion protein)
MQPFFRSSVLVGGLLILTALASCRRDTESAVERSAAKARNAALRVKIEPVKRKETIRLTTTQPGRIVPYEEAPLFARINGEVKEVLVDLGDVVQPDQVLARLNVPDMEKDKAQKVALEQQAASEVIQAEKNIAVAREVAAVAKGSLGEAKAAVLKSEAAYNFAKSEFDRLAKLAEGGSIALKVKEEKELQYRSASAGWQEARAKEETAAATLKKSEVQITKATADHAVALAKQKVAAAGVAHIEAMLQFAQIRAPRFVDPVRDPVTGKFTSQKPVPGKITRRKIDPGHLVGPNIKTDSPLFVVTRLDKVRILIDVPEVEAEHVDVGDPVSIKIPALKTLSQTEFVVEGGVTKGEKGPKITRTSVALRPPTRTLRAEVELDSQGGKLRPGMYAIVSIIEEERANALTVPLSAIVTKPKQPEYVFVVENDRAVRKPVKVGLRTDTDAEILSGLREGELVITNRLDSVREGQRVVTTLAKKDENSTNGTAK